MPKTMKPKTISKASAVAIATAEFFIYGSFWKESIDFCNAFLVIVELAFITEAIATPEEIAL